MNFKPLIFLDMDGVLNNDRALLLSSRTGICPSGNYNFLTVSHMCVELFQKLVKKVDARIIISSSWRPHELDNLFYNEISVDGYSYGNTSVVNALEWAGFKDCKKYIIGNTPYNKDNTIIRGIEIQKWLDSHPNYYTKDVTPYVILDDDSDMTEEQIQNHFVKTNSKKGFQMSDYEKALEILQNVEEGLF